MRNLTGTFLSDILFLCLLSILFSLIRDIPDAEIIARIMAELHISDSNGSGSKQSRPDSSTVESSSSSSTIVLQPRTELVSYNVPTCFQ